jgi:hypothetical protein
MDLPILQPFPSNCPIDGAETPTSGVERKTPELAPGLTCRQTRTNSRRQDQR